MKFRMFDGSVVDAVKDCECVTHTVPHWVHMDNINRMLNDRLLEGGSFLGTIGFAKEEGARLSVKLFELKSRGIIEIIKEEGDVL
jgi:hypothetical protein